MSRPPVDAMVRFINMVDKTEDCWLWLGSGDKRGYGQFRNENSIMEKSHRFAYRNLVKEIPEGLLVLHKCDNPSCCNPMHLFLGTYQDNSDDCKRKGRTSKLYGEFNGMHGKTGAANPMFGKAGFGGKHHSEESRRMISESNKETWIRRKLK